MGPKELKKLREMLLAEKKVLEAELTRIGGENPAIKGDWKAHFHKNDPSDTADEKARSVSEFEEERAVEQNLELRLKEINETLERIDKGEYGTCDKCGSAISPKRLEAVPAVKYCIECAKKVTLT